MDFHTDYFTDNDGNEIEVEVKFEQEYQPSEKDIGISSGYIAYFIDAKPVDPSHMKNWDKLDLAGQVYYRDKWMENIEKTLND